MEFLMIGSGLGIVVGSILLRPDAGRSSFRVVLALAVAAATTVVSSTIALATHTEYTSVFYADLASPWNGHKVFLSSPRHSESGNKHECGWDENINGRHWNYYAASVNTGGLGAIEDRGYDVVVSPNSKDNNYAAHWQYADSWGADIYIVTHTNGAAPCGTSTQYLLVMNHGGSNSTGLKNELLYWLDPVVPGTQTSWRCDGVGYPYQTLDECMQPDATHRAYVELFFHTNWTAVNWFQGNGSEGSGGVNESWRYGAAIDVRLGSPR